MKSTAGKNIRIYSWNCCQKLPARFISQFMSFLRNLTPARIWQSRGSGRWKNLRLWPFGGKSHFQNSVRLSGIAAPFWYSAKSLLMPRFSQIVGNY